MHNDPEVEKKQGWITVGELEGCVHYKVGRKARRRGCSKRLVTDRLTSCVLWHVRASLLLLQ